MVLGTAFERYFELASQVLVVLVADEITKKSLSVRQNIEGLGGRRACAITGSNIAHCVAARFSRGDAAFCQEAKEVRCFFKLNVVDLYIFSGSQMNEATAKTVRRIRQTDQLVRGQESTGDLDPLHLHSFLTLGIGPEVQAQFLHLRLIKFTGTVFLDLLFV